MLNGHHKNSGCGFDEQLISYLYNEIKGAEKFEFERHLNNCSSCADEFAAFSGVQSSINDWKINEFANLQTPVFKIPFADSVTSTIKQKPSDITDAWLSGLRQLFSLSPRAWSLATASFMVLAVCVGIVFLELNYQKNNELSQNNKQLNPIISPTIEQTKVISPSETPEIKLPNKPSKPEIVKSDIDSKNSRTVKIVDSSRQPKKIENAGGRKNNDFKINNKINNQPRTPKVVIEDEEDNSLRLAELFDEIGTR